MDETLDRKEEGDQEYGLGGNNSEASTPLRFGRQGTQRHEEEIDTVSKSRCADARLGMRLPL
jgi:hypothetical protein